MTAGQPTDERTTAGQRALAEAVAHEFLRATSGHALLIAQLENERRIVTDNARAARAPRRQASRRAYQAAWARNRRALGRAS